MNIKTIVSDFLTYSNALIPQKSAKSFVVVTHGRTGSTLLFDLLSKHPSIDYNKSIYNGEIFTQKKHFPRLYIKGKVNNKNFDYYGFKVKIFDHLIKTQNINDARKLKSFFDYLVDRDCKIIYLKRDNIFLIAMSILLAIKRNKWHFSSSENHQIQNKQYIDKYELLRCMEVSEYRQFKELEILSFFNYLPVLYEEDLVDPGKHQITCDRIFDFLEIQNYPVQTNLIRTSDDDLSLNVSNYREIIEFINKTRFSIYLKNIPEYCSF